MEVDEAYDEVEEESEVEREDPFVTDSQEEGHDDDCEVSIYIYMYIYFLSSQGNHWAFICDDSLDRRL